MDIKRITSGLLGFPLVLIVLIIGNVYVVDIALAIIAILAMDEYFNAISKISKPVRWIGYVSCISIALIHIIPEEYLVTMSIVAIPIVLLILFAQVIITEMKTNFKDIAYTFFGIMYVVVLLMFFAKINGMENGNILIWYVIFAAWGTDIFAYFIGKHFGKHKFSKISPKKSIEGCIAGTIGAIIIMLVYTYVANTFWGMQYSYIKYRPDMRHTIYPVYQLAMTAAATLIQSSTLLFSEISFHTPAAISGRRITPSSHITFRQ